MSRMATSRSAAAPAAVADARAMEEVEVVSPLNASHSYLELGSGNIPLYVIDAPRPAQRAKARNCSALEITLITRFRFPGVSRFSISAHIRHFQKGSVSCGK